jgi:hypothetical protein
VGADGRATQAKFDARKNTGAGIDDKPNRSGTTTRGKSAANTDNDDDEPGIQGVDSDDEKTTKELNTQRLDTSGAVPQPDRAAQPQQQLYEEMAPPQNTVELNNDVEEDTQAAQNYNNAKRREEEDRQSHLDVDHFSEGVKRARKKEQVQEDRETTLFNLQVAQGARDKEKHAASTDKEKSRVCAPKEDLRDGTEDANKRALAAGLGLSDRRAPGQKGTALLGQAWSPTSNTE